MLKTKVSNPKYHPPEGGWGWIIVLAYGIANIIKVPMLQGFGLIYKDKFSDMGMSATEFSTIINLNSAFSMSIGLASGPLLKLFGYRKIAAASGIIFSSGLFFTSFATCFTHFIITYSIITSIGTGLSTSSFSLALNAYFKNRRNKAAGIAMTITGLGPIFIPQVISLLLFLYSTQGCLMIVSAISLHIVVAACLLQPVKWHNLLEPVQPIAIAIPIPEIDEDYDPDEAMDRFGESEASLDKRTRIITAPSSPWELSDDDEDDYLDQPCKVFNLDHDIDTQIIYGIEAMPHMKRKVYNDDVLGTPSTKISLNNLSQSKSTNDHFSSNQSPVLYNKPKERAMSLTSDREHEEFLASRLVNSSKRWFDSGSADTVNLGSSVGIFDEERRMSFPAGASKIVQEEKRIVDRIRRASLKPTHTHSLSATNLEKIAEEEEENLRKNVRRAQQGEVKPKKNNYISNNTARCWAVFKQRTVELFDLDLLNDKIYVNIVLGLSLAIFGEINFSMFTPFILNDLNYSTIEIATLMSVLAIADIVCRFISPFIGDYFGKSPRIMFMYSLVMLIVSRTLILYVDTFTSMVFVSIALGVAKGVRSVYMGLIIPAYVTLDRLPSAAGLQMVMNSIFLLVLGPFVGIIRDKYNSFVYVIVFINILTLISLGMWSAEYIYFAYRKYNLYNKTNSRNKT